MASAVVRQTLAAQVQGVLATVGPNGAPCTFLMAFATARDCRSVLLATPLAARKALHMLARPAVSLLFDDRTGKLADHADGILVTAAGHARQLTDEQRRDDGLRIGEAREIFLAKNPNMYQFLGEEGIGLFEVDVHEYEVVKGYGRPELWVPQHAVAPSS